MQQFTTAAAAPQAPPPSGEFPVVSYRLELRTLARRDAARYDVNEAPVLEAVDGKYRATRGNRAEARRAGWDALDAQLQGRAPACVAP